MSPLHPHRLAPAALAVLLATSQFGVLAQDGRAAGAIKTDELKEWLGYVASDALEGRNTFSEGLGLAGGYIAAHLQAWGVKPGGDNGSYFQRVPVLDIKTTNKSSVTVETNGRTRTFKHGEGIDFPTNAGGAQTLTIDKVVFAGYGLNIPAINHNDYAELKAAGAAVVWLGAAGPEGLDQQYRRVLTGRSRYALETVKAAAVIGVPVAGGFRGAGAASGNAMAGASPSGGTPSGGTPSGGTPSAGTPSGGTPPQVGRGQGAGQQQERPDFTAVQRLDRTVPPSATARDEFFDFLFSGAPVKYPELKARVDKREPVSGFALDGVKLTFNVEAEYKVTRTQYTRNVVGLVEGSDPRLKDTYVAFGAHYDHVGYREPAAPGAPQPTRGDVNDNIMNGADDDGSGTVAMMGIAKAFATGPKPRRSVIFVWHAGEERGLLGSRYFADWSPLMPDKIVAQLNMDMVGRNSENKDEFANTVFLIGSDRISTELHNLNEDANAALSKPLIFDYAYNDPTDPQSLYTRSDHYSYAARGVPIIFYTTGLHPDYHQRTDHADLINYEKMTRIAQLVYATGIRVANLDHAPVRDNKGPRAGKGSKGKLTD